ncbi:metal-dependent hydrolase [Cryobacterium zhongshanensis]|uniref:Metal-dependent hydrolase n=1 Tax=Cryobacterium zhongshanensis TaxID=2928153 RepID=A0AA41UGE0_9MICO|nr:metal-dependent hydrolase [Cryobacterium zhongshanensis]MCI4659633.1 metal-dependent hydrolase [Cryobacterium zhongshanensis]
MMGHSHLVANGAIAATAFVWLGALRDQTSATAVTSDAWIREVASWPTSIIGQGIPAWVGDHPVSGAAQWIWAWLFPHEGAGGVVYLVAAVLLLALGTLVPDLDSKHSMLGRWLPFGMPGPHRGLLHTDWALIALFVVALAPPTRLIVWLWLGAWLHCAMDGLSASGRARFYPLGRYRLVRLPSGEVSVGQTGRHVALYQAGGTGEWVLLGGLLAACALAIAAALRP